MELNHVHDWERALVSYLNYEGWKLSWCGGGYDHYDAQGKTPKGYDCVIEMKFRNKFYETKMLEKYKYDKLMEMDASIRKLYVVCDPEQSIIFDLERLDLSNPERIDCPTTTLWDNDKVSKQVYLLDPKLGYEI